MLTSPAYFPMFPSSCLAVLFTGMLVVIICVNDEHFRWDDKVQRGLERDITIGRKKEAASSAIIPTIHRISFHAFSIVQIPNI
jgi:hypothetical protein